MKLNEKKCNVMFVLTRKLKLSRIAFLNLNKIPTWVEKLLFQRTVSCSGLPQIISTLIENFTLISYFSRFLKTSDNEFPFASHSSLWKQLLNQNTLELYVCDLRALFIVWIIINPFLFNMKKINGTRNGHNISHHFVMKEW